MQRPRPPRNKFMSSKISDIHSGPPGDDSRKRKAGEEDEDEQARQLFRQLRREAEALGITGLEEKERRKVESKAFLQLGARPKKKQRFPLAVGSGMVKKAAEREEQQRTLARAEGMQVAPKKKKAENGRERGLKASEGVFKNGVLYVTPPPKPERGQSSTGPVSLTGRKRLTQMERTMKKKSKSKGKGKGKGKKRGKR